jgi:chitin disaccharide deacetylase
VTRYLIVNADDFGLSDRVNEGVVQAHETGIVTSATLMVHAPAAASAAAYARVRPSLSVGLHIDLGEWVYGVDAWTARYERVDLLDRDAVVREVNRQVATFQNLVGAPPTHLDSHQHVHRSEPVAAAVQDMGERLGVPVRDQSPTVTYRGDFYGQTGKGEPYPDAITVEALVAVFESLRPGYTELGCHPGRTEPDLDTVYRDERQVEVDILCHPRVRQALASRAIELVSFHDVPRAGLPHPSATANNS